MKPALLLASFAVILAVLIAQDPPLGHDEAVYAMGGRALVDGAEPSGFESYRPAGMAVIAAPGVALGGAPWALRLVPALLTLGLLAAGWSAARGWTGPRAAAIVAGATMAWPHLPWRGAMLLSDVPSALACVGMTWGLVAIVRGETPWRAAIGAAVCAAAAFYLRYGAVITIATTSLACLVWARRGAFVLYAGLLALAILPFVIYSVHVSGSPLGVLEHARSAAGRRYVGDGLVYYAKTWFTVTGGPVMGFVAAVGVVATFVRSTPLRRVLGGSAVVQILWLGLTAHGEPRFVLFPMLLLTIVGAEILAEHATPAVVRAGAALVALSVAVIVPLSIRAMRHVEDFTGPIAAAGEAVRADARGAPCRVLTRQVPQLAYYSRCPARRLRASTAARLLKDGAPAYLVMFRADPEADQLRAMPGVTSTEIAPHVVRLEMR